jgi:hypothetical protein
MSTNIQRCIEACRELEVHGDSHEGASAELAAKELERLRDDPQRDATDAAHPAWWRGQEAAAKHWAARFSRFSLICDRLQTIADEAFGPFPTEPAETLMTLIEAGITALRVKNGELERLLASGQCVDLSKVDDMDLGDKAAELYRRWDHSTQLDGEELKAWIIKEAEVKL